MNCRVNRSIRTWLLLRLYGLDPLLPTLGYHSMSGIRRDIVDVTTPLVGGCAALPFDRYTVKEDDHERYGLFGHTVPVEDQVGEPCDGKPSRTIRRLWDLGCFTLFQKVDFSTIFAHASAPRNSWISCNMRLNAITLICILLFISAIGKSARIGSHTWSPDAMEGSTSVFMIARCSPLFEYPPTALIVITFAGAMTVIAYSTCGQLGYMIFACGISNYSVSVFHLMNHAFFKELLFLSAGSVIHAMELASSFPFTYAMMLMGNLSLIGFPFLNGFYSKDVILELAYTKYTISGNFALRLGNVSVLFTSYYSFHSLFLTFLVPTNSFG
ncbi:unnamed protein product [Withania somnifera]